MLPCELNKDTLKSGKGVSFPAGSSGKESASSAGGERDEVSIPGL